MSNGLFAVDGVDIAGLVAEHLGPRVLEASLQTFTTGARDANKLTGGKARTPNPPVPARGFWKDYSPRQIDGQAVLKNDRKAIILGGTTPTPPLLVYNDEITMEGVTLYVVRVERRDPAGARFVYQCRDRRGPDGQ
jgi:hypothetical protein